MELTRRHFLGRGLQIGACLSFLPELARVGIASSQPGERVLVVLQLSGGNDGLNTVIPYRQDNYWRLRPTLGLARGALQNLDSEHALHPAMNGMAELFQEGHLAVIHGAGSPNPDRSHFRALEMWHTADPFGPAADHGWLGRLADQIAAAEPRSTPALAIENGNLPLSMRGERFLAPTVADPKAFRETAAAADFVLYRNQLLGGQAQGDLQYLRSAAYSTYEAAARMNELADRSASAAYPASELAERLRWIAALIAGGFGTRIFHLSLEGFDTHARQAPVHENLLRQLSEALTAFQADLRERGAEERVLTLVFSEFGRRAAENGSKGTDHGNGAPAFVIGSRVRGGFHGRPPDLSILEDGDIPQTTDFRAIYTTLERDWMGLRPSTAVAGLDLLA